MKCPYCGEEAEYGPNEEYYGRRYVSAAGSYMCYYCLNCDAYVGTHQNSTRPLGTMANKQLRKLRMEAHALIDPLWKSHKYKRQSVYQRLSEAFGRQIHVGESDEDTCRRIIETVPMLFTR